MVNRGRRRSISGSDRLVETDEEAAADEQPVERDGPLCQLCHGGDLVRLLGRSSGMVGKWMQLDRAEPLRKLCLSDQGKKQVTIVLEVEGAHHTDVPLALIHPRL